MSAVIYDLDAAEWVIEPVALKNGVQCSLYAANQAGQSGSSQGYLGEDARLGDLIEGR